MLIQELSPGLPVDLDSFITDVFQMPASDNLMRWLFLNSPNTITLCAHEDDRIVATLGMFKRVYQHMDGHVECLESFNWLRRPGREYSGIGITLLKAFMERGQPMVALGGSDHTVRLMPKHGYATLAAAPVLVLPLRPSALSHIGGMRGALARFGLRAVKPFVSPKQNKSTEIEWRPVSRITAAILNSQGLPGFQANYDEAFFNWLTQGYPELGNFVPFYFEREGAFAGWTFVRVAREADGQLVGRILETKFAPWSTADMRRAMLEIVCYYLAGCQVSLIRALTTCPDTVAALRSLHFRSRSNAPAMVYPAGRRFGGEPIRISVLRADGGIWPR